VEHAVDHFALCRIALALSPVRAAAEVMSVDELAEFSLVPRTELPVKPRPARTAVRAGSPRKKRTASSAASAREADQPADANR